MHSGIMALPRAAYEIVRAALKEADYDREVITQNPRGGNTVAIDMEGFLIFPDDDTDTIINSGRLSDLMVQSNEEAFRAGFEAAMVGETQMSWWEAWGHYTPSKDILDLQDNL